MVFRGSLLVLVVVTGAAQAQAPGQTASEPVAGARDGAGVMAHRWAVDLSIGGASLKPKGGTGGTGFGVLSLAGRFRWRPALELAVGVELGGGTRDQVELSMGGLYVDVRYRFMAERRWNVVAFGGLGAGSVAAKDGTDAERKGRAMLRLGGGVERRFGRFALEAGLHLIAIAEHKQLATPASPGAGDPFARYGVSGLAILIGGTYYF